MNSWLKKGDVSCVVANGEEQCYCRNLLSGAVVIGQSEEQHSFSTHRPELANQGNRETGF